MREVHACWTRVYWVCSCEHVYRDLRRTQGTFHHAPFYPLPEAGVHRFLARLRASQPQQSSCLWHSLPPRSGVTGMCSHSWFSHIGAEELNSVPCVCTLSTLPCWGTSQISWSLTLKPVWRKHPFPDLTQPDCHHSLFKAEIWRFFLRQKK